MILKKMSNSFSIPPSQSNLHSWVSLVRQGRHAKGLEDQSLIIKWLEGQIALHSAPKPIVYQLAPVK